MISRNQNSVKLLPVAINVFCYDYLEFFLFGLNVQCYGTARCKMKVVIRSAEKKTFHKKYSSLLSIFTWIYIYIYIALMWYGVIFLSICIILILLLYWIRKTLPEYIITSQSWLTGRYQSLSYSSCIIYPALLMT